MNFDWYGASIDAVAPEIAAEALRAFDMASWYPCRPRNGFNRAQELRRGDMRIATLAWENLGAPSSRSSYLEASGRHSSPVASWVRSLWPKHRVARADVAEDYTGPGVWDRLSGLCLGVADRHGVKVEHAGDHHRALDGRSIYIGGRASVVRAIVYEKGKQLGGDPNHVRLELRTRPGTRSAKAQAAALAPAQFYGGAIWSVDLGRCIGVPEIQRLSLGTVYREEDHERSVNALLGQYHRVLRRLRTDCGGWAELGEYIGRKLGDS